jgi:CRP-like cAMP-binding protein
MIYYAKRPKMDFILPLFQDLEPAQMVILQPIMQVFSHPPETALFEQGERATYLYLILKGSVIIQYKPYDGPMITITQLHAGDLCGWSAVVGRKDYSSGCVSTTDVEVVRISRKDLWSLVKEHPDVGRIVLNRLADIATPRWKFSHIQVQAMLDHSLDEAKRNADDEKGHQNGDR